MSSEIVIVDTEFTTWEGALQSGWAEDWQLREIVQIAAIRFDPVRATETDSLDILVKPEINNTLSDYFIKLTDITQQQVDANGLNFPEALAAFVDFCNGIPADGIVCYGVDEQIIRENCALHDLNFPFSHPFRNFRLSLAAFDIDHLKYNSGQLHTLTDQPLTGRTHNALHDVRSIAAFMAYKIAQGHSSLITNIPYEESVA